jgi:uncharacterized RDD family membrane protein YckC
MACEMNEENNPYQSPSISSMHPQISLEPLEVIPVGKGLRFANYLIDMIVAQLAIGFMIGIFAVVILGDGSEEFLNSPLLNLALFLCLPIYYILMEGIFGRTLGKLITGTVVVDGFGNKPSFGKIIGRSFARLIPFEAFSFLGSTGRGWHDSLTDTYVVKSR